MRHRSLLAARLSLRRRPILYWVTTLVVAAACALVVGSLTAQAERAAARYGGLQSVVVVVRPVGVGDIVGASAVQVERIPRAFVPDGAVSSVPDERTALTPLYPGEVVLAERLAPDGVHGVAALLPAGSVALAVPTGAGALSLAVGDVVDVLATAGDGSTRTVAAGAQVVDAGDSTATVAVRSVEAPAVATALTQATVTLALSAGG